VAKDDKRNDYGVGYGKPPMHSQFKHGQSGNPKGRPKGTLNLATVLAQTLRESVVINENGQRKTITKLEAATKQLTNKAASGDLTALRHLITLVLTVEERSKAVALPPSPALDDADQKVLASVLKRLESSRKGGEDK
jgi:hypothetical protein